LTEKDSLAMDHEQTDLGMNGHEVPIDDLGMDFFSTGSTVHFDEISRWCLISKGNTKPLLITCD